VANTLNLYCQGDVGFIDWLDLFQVFCASPSTVALFGYKREPQHWNTHFAGCTVRPTVSGSPFSNLSLFYRQDRHTCECGIDQP
jgi:hypothetical protein